jgi:hypothetical protein
MSCLDEQQISSVSLGFNNEVIKVTSDYNCLLLKEIFERGFDDNDHEVKIQQDSFIFKTYILENKSFEDEKKLDFENLFQVLGYFGASEKLKELTVVYKRYYSEQYYNRESVRKLFQKRLDEKDCEEFNRSWETNGNVDGPMIEKYKRNNWELIATNENLDLDFIKKHHLIFECVFSAVLSNRHINLDFIKDRLHMKNFDWVVLWENDKISEKTFETIIEYVLIHHTDEINWKVLLSNPVITENFIQKYYISNKDLFDQIGTFDITIALRNPNVSERFVLNIFNDYKNIKIDQLFWGRYIARKETLSEVFFINLENEKKLPDYNCHFFWTSLILNPNISCKFIEDRFDKIDRREIFKTIYFKKNLELWFVQKYIDEITDMYYLCQNPIIEKLIDCKIIDIEKIGDDEWEALCSNEFVSEAFFRKHIEKIDWDMLSGNAGLNENFFEEYEDHVTWEYLLQNTFRLKHVIDYKKSPLYKYMSKF